MLAGSYNVNGFGSQIETGWKAGLSGTGYLIALIKAIKV